ncbi:MAG TPA: HEAT repeat domain-containing protein [Pyrinomonadaceae bacterium]|nr:HEAT repeat domain-containing protein [Pyrinomonadaceae bacterium]
MSANLVAGNPEPMPPAQLAAEEVKMEPDNQPDQEAGDQPQSEIIAPATSEKKSASAMDQVSREFAPSEGFDQAVHDLRAGESPETRAAAARILAGAGSQRATPHLIAALFDADATVRSTASEVLAQFGNSNVANTATSQGVGKAPAVKPAAASPLQTSVETAKVSASRPAETKAEEAPATVSQPDTPAGAATKDPQQLLVQENEVRAKLHELESQIQEIIAARKEAEQEIRRHIESEAKLRAEAAARRDEEEQLRRQAYEEVERRIAEDEKRVAAEQKTRVAAEKEARRLANEETHIRLEAVRRRQTAQDLLRERVKVENARVEATEAAQLLEAKRLRQEAAEQHQAELEKLRRDEESLRAAFEKVAHRRAEVETARAKAEKEAELLVEARARMRAAEEARNQAEAERLQLESEMNERLATERRQLEETRQRGIEEHQRLIEETQRVAEEQQARLKELSEMRQKAETEGKQRAEQEQHLLAQIESLRISDAETRKRIEEAEMRRHTSDEAYKLAAEKLQRIEAEAHARSLEEEQMLTRLEAARRTVAVEAQSRSEQEKRIKEEIEMFHRLEEEERPRLEAAVLQRTEAETRFRKLREQYEVEQQALASAEQFSLTDVGELPQAVAASTDSTSAPDLVAPKPERSAGSVVAGRREEVPPAIAAYLASIDPYKRAAAVGELGRSGSQEAFNIIANSFDDSSSHVRNAAARALRRLEPSRTVDLFNRAMEEGSEERRQNIGAAIAASGVAAEAIENLVSESREETYNSLSILFVMAKTGEVEPLIKAIEEHPSDEVRRAVVKLLNLSGQSDVADAALQRHVLGVPAVRQNGVAKEPVETDRAAAAESEVKRVVRKQNGNGH